jgi:general secretion pathway protein G
MKTNSSRRAGFTLIELLTVIAIIGILAAIIIPTVGKVRDSAKKSQCASNLRQIGMAMTLYAGENKGLLPLLKDASLNRHWTEILAPIIGGKENSTGQMQGAKAVLNCPAWPNDAVYNEAHTWKGGYGMNPRVNFPDDLTEYINSAVRQKMPTTNHPARRILAGDASDWYIEARASGITAFPTRHGAKGNYVFADGHVATLEMRETNKFLRDADNSGRFGF